MSEKLLPCPFCRLPVRTEKSEEPRLHRPSRNGWHVVCNGCELLFGYDVDYAGVFETEEEAIAAWNKRTLSKTETVKYLEIEAIKNDHSGEANGMVEPVKDSYKLNEPLTLEELKQMAEEPYYHVSLQGNGNRWAILDWHRAKYIEDYHYGERWLAYRHKKEEGE